jgi:hypothetical protein
VTAQPLASLPTCTTGPRAIQVATTSGGCTLGGPRRDRSPRR